MYTTTTNPGYTGIKRGRKLYKRKYKKQNTGTVAVYPRKNALVYGAIRPEAIFERSEIKEHHATNAIGLGNFSIIKFKSPPINTSLSDVKQGTQWDQRIGSKIKAVDITIKLFTYLTGQTQNYFDVVRVILIQDRQCNLAPPNWESCMAGEDAAITCMQDPQTSSRYKILYDNCFNIRWATNYENREFTIYRRLYDQIEYRGAANGDYAAILSNSLTLWCVSNRLDANSLTNVGYSSRLRFTDC